MFDYFRLFSLISFLMVIALTVGAGVMFRGVATEDISRQIEISNSGIAESYIEKVWKQHPEAVAIFKNNISERDKTDPVAMQKVQDFGKDSVHYFKKMPLLRVNIYNAAGALLISSNVGTGDSIASNEVSPDKSFILAKFRETNISSQQVNNIKLQSTNAGTVLQTLVPVVMPGRDGAANAEGMLELVSDMTKPLDNFTNTQIKASIYMLAFFLLYLGVLFFMVRRTEAIISKQHEANAELAAAVAMAQSENREKSQFLANV